MGTLDIVMVVFLGVVVVGGMIGFLIYNFRSEDE